MEAEYTITICLGSSCFSKGSKNTLEVIKAYVKEKGLESKVFLRGDLCASLCEKGPILKINDKVFYRITGDMVYELLNQFFDEEASQ